MVAIPKETFVLKIEEAIENQTIVQQPRPYFGISGIGSSCARDLWYSFRWATESKITPRQQRLFNRGHREEPIIIKDLIAIGCEVKNRQKGMTTGYGHIKGHIDGTVSNVPDASKTEHLLELKTANNSNFKSIKKDGIEKSKPDYFAQVQCYMHLLKLKRTLFVVVNKDNDERYYERIRYDKEVAEKYFARAEDIILSEFPPTRIGGASWYECKWCDHYLLCQYDEEPLKNCRTCQHLDMHKGGRWRCSYLKQPRSVAKQREGKGCPWWVKMEGLK